MSRQYRSRRAPALGLSISPATDKAHSLSASGLKSRGYSNRGARDYADYLVSRAARQAGIPGSEAAENPAMQALRIEAGYDRHPGRAEGSTGLTGLASFDKQGYDDLLAERRDYARLLDYLGFTKR